MAEAAITLKLTPAEFDLVREALTDQAAVQRGLVGSRTDNAKLRAEAREREARLLLVLDKLR